MKNILWLTEWLPTFLEPFAGDGIERRAKAASLFNDISIIYVKKNPHLPFGKVEKEERKYNEHCTAIIYYYPSIKKISRFLDLLLSNYYFIRLHRKAFRDFKKKKGKPAGIQVNVTMKDGIIALLYKLLWRINYIVVEGWSLFLPEEKPQFRDKGWLFRFLTYRVLKNSSLLVTVSKHLGEVISHNVINVPYQVVPSAVDERIFYPASKVSRHTPFRFIHVSNLARTKNIGQILSGLQQIISRGYSAELVIHAPFNKELISQINLLKLENNVILKEEVNQELLADSIRSSDALILFSLYETFGNVIIEAQACGLPVVTSNYPVFFETIDDYKNGIIARGNDASSLAAAMSQCIENYHKFDPHEISRSARERYSFGQIGKMLDDIYKTRF